MNSNQCSFCGRKRNEVQMLISGQNGFICENCIEQAHAIVKDSSSKSGYAPAENINELKKPKEIKEFLDQYVIGQDQAKKTIVDCCVQSLQEITSRSGRKQRGRA